MSNFTLFPCFIIIITFMQSIYNYIPETTPIVLQLFCIYNLCHM
jgi:ABC-type arginine/histidine transport system permease subunit